LRGSPVGIGGGFGGCAMSSSSHAHRKSGTLFSRWMVFAEAFWKLEGFIFIAGLLLITGGLLAFSAQGRDLIRVIVDDGTEAKTPSQWLPLYMLYAATLFLGLQAWFWARTIVDVQFGLRKHWQDNPFLVWTPRLFALMPFGFLLAAMAQSYLTTRVEVPVVVLSMLSAALLLFMIVQDALHRRAREETEQRRGTRQLLFVLASARLCVLGAGFLLAVVAFVAVLKWPVGPALWMGPAAVVLFATALIIPPATVLAQAGSVLRLPVLGVLLVIYGVFSLWNDNHAVEIKTSPALRPTLAQAWARWRAQAEPVNGAVPLIFVAAEGGASRAAFWTGHALALLDERTHGEFSRHTFLISAVSGSTVGAVAVLAGLKDNPALANGGLVGATDDFTGRDFLSATLAGLFFPDLAQRFVPVPVLPDRALYLERAFEWGWRAHCADSPGRCHDAELLGTNFLGLWPEASGDNRWLPMLVVGGAREETGRRILTSNASFARDQIDADDFHALAGGDVSISTAILNGARSPYISPGGTLPAAAGGHIIDGGYFDNGGVETMREAAATALSTDSDSAVPPAFWNAPLKPIFLLLVNSGPWESASTTDEAEPDPTRMPVRNDVATTAPRKSATDVFAADLLGPVIGTLATRDALSQHLRHLLEQAVIDADVCTRRGACPERPPVLAPELISLHVCSSDFPLDWILSARTRALMKAQLDGTDARTTCGNREKIDHLVSVLGG